MKKLLLLLFAVISIAIGASAQSYTQRWNDLYKRTEFFDSYGRMIGYAKYNDLYKRMEYYDAYGNLQKTEQRCLALKKVDSQKVNKMIKFQSLPRQKRQAIREEVLRMYAETDMSYVEIAEVNGVQLRTVEYIIRNFASELPETPVMRKNKKDASAEDYDALRAEITRLKKELRHEKMRAEALDTMIDVAEEMFNIPVRKKAGTKQ